jgi:hypothetical protein
MCVGRTDTLPIQFRQKISNWHEQEERRIRRGDMGIGKEEAEGERDK